MEDFNKKQIEKLTRISFSLYPTTIQQLKCLAQLHGRSCSNYLRWIIDWLYYNCEEERGGDDNETRRN